MYRTSCQVVGTPLVCTQYNSALYNIIYAYIYIYVLVHIIYRFYYTELFKTIL